MLAFEHAASFSLQVNSQSDATTSCLIRGFTSEGPFVFTHIPTNNSIIKTETFRIPDFPIMLTVTDGDGVLIQGQTFITIRLLINGDVYQELCAGWVYRQKALAYPATNQVDMRPGGGFLATESSANPAAGAEISLTVPAGEVWHIKGYGFTLVTDGNAANRNPHVIFTVGGSVIFKAWNETDQTASVTGVYSGGDFGDGISSADSNDFRHNIPSNIVMQNPDTITTLTDAILVGDNLSAMAVRFERYFTPA